MRQQIYCTSEQDSGFKIASDFLRLSCRVCTLAHSFMRVPFSVIAQQVFLQQIYSEIVLAIMPDGVNVVGIVLCVVVFDNERWPDESVVVALSRLCAAGPRETDKVEVSFANAFEFMIGKLSPQVVCEFANELFNQFTLRCVHFGS